MKWRTGSRKCESENSRLQPSKRRVLYRPDWLDAWARGREPLPKPESSGFMAPLWRQLREQIGRPHRGERLHALVAALHAGALPNPEPLHVFGISHLAPSELAVLRAVARARLVVLYVPDPCREHWSGLRRENHKLATQGARP